MGNLKVYIVLFCILFFKIESFETGATTCPFLSEIQNGKVVHSGRNLHAVVRYECNLYFKLIGNAQRSCQEDGTWTGVLPVCQEITCLEPGVTQHVRVIPAPPQLRKAGDLAIFACKFGPYRQVTSKCLATGEWSNRPPTCPGPLVTESVPDSTMSTLSTEGDLEGNRTCPYDSLPCDDGECVSRGKWCDGEKNCQDESDEAYCKKRSWWAGVSGDDPNFCSDTHFLCNNGQCIPLVGKCDGFEDCKDKSDEWNCEPETGGPEADVEYEDYLLSTTTSEAPTETTSIESSSVRDGLEKDDVTTTTQSSHPIFTKVRKGKERENSTATDGATPTESTDCPGHNSSPVLQEGLFQSQKRKTEKSEAEKRIESALNFLQMFTEKPEKDERSAFCELLCIQLREMDANMRLVAMHEINSVIFRLKRASHSAIYGGAA